MNIHKLLAGTLAIVLVSGIGIPAFAVDYKVSPVDGPSVTRDNLLTPADHDNMIFNGGGPNLVNAYEFTFWVEADDFEFPEHMVLTDVHLWGCDLGTPWDGTIEWWVFEDNAGSPGAIVDQGNGVLAGRTLTGEIIADTCDEYVMDFDLDHEVSLDGNVRYWLGLHMAPDFTTVNGDYWELTDNAFGADGMTSLGGTFDNWEDFGVRFAFFLTGHPPGVVGGDLLPIDNTALLLAGLQSSSVWILSSLAVIGSVTFGILYIKTKRD